jgi:dienelactone hydrolase
MARANVAEENGYRREPFEAGGITHDVYRGGDMGPVVLLLHEMPSLSWRTVILANHIRGQGFRIVIPILVGGVRGKPVGRAGKAIAPMAAGIEFGVNLVKVCVSWQFVALLQRRTSPITLWLLQLAREEAARHGQRQVGVIGMCFSGGFALATAIDPVVGVAVVSQPALPFAAGPLKLIPGQGSDLGLSDPDHARLVGRKDEPDLCIRAFRYESDSIAPKARVQRIEDELGPAATLTWIPGRGHPVLTNATDGDAHPTARAALDAALRSVVETLDERLRP